MLKARDAIRQLKSYHPPLGHRDGLRLDFNENTVGCAPRVLERLRTLHGEQLARYPQRDPVERVVAKHLEVEPAELLLTNGTDEAIHLICETYLEPGDQALIVVPTFAMYEIYAAQTGAQVATIPAGADFRFPTEDVLGAIHERTRLIAVANPNNPTGALASRECLLRIAESAPHAAVLIDEAYFEFCGETLMKAWRNVPNLFVSRTFSKAYGLAGLRIGVLTGNVEQMPMLRQASSPYNLNSVALACLPDALAEEEHIRGYVNDVRMGRKNLELALSSRGIKYWPSHGNFVLMYFGDLSTGFISAMRARQILVRDRSSDPGCQGCVRITVGSAEHNQRLLSVFPEVLAEIGMTEKVTR
jgi:histidinol-phosphate aminotransferase